MTDRDENDLDRTNEFALRPLPTFETITRLSRIVNRGNVEVVELERSLFQDIIRCFLQSMPFDAGSYFSFNPSLSGVDDPRRHWRDHGYFERRKLLGWEDLDFDVRGELLGAPNNYFRLLRDAGILAHRRLYSAAERAQKSAVATFPNGITSHIALAELTFKLRRPLESEVHLRNALALNPRCSTAHRLLVEVLVDVGRSFGACEISLASGELVQTAKHSLRLIERGDLRVVRRQLPSVTDDWPLAEKLRQRVASEWKHHRALLAKYHALIRRREGDAIRYKAALSSSLAKLGYGRTAARMVGNVLSAADSQTAPDFDVAVILDLIEAIRVTRGPASAIEFIQALPPESSHQDEVLAEFVRLAEDSCLPELVLQVVARLGSGRATPRMLQSQAHALVYLKRFRELYFLCRREWHNVRVNAWMPGVVLLAGRAEARFAGVSGDVVSSSSQTSEPIPRHIVQFWDREAPPEDVLCLVQTWRDKHPLYGYTRFSDASAREFIKLSFGSQYAELFDFCHHPVMRADYFRLAYLVAKGGIYVDVDEFCSQSLDTLFDENPGKDLFASLSVSEFFVNNRFIAAAPGHPFLRAVLDNVVRDLRAYSQAQVRADIWLATGPFQYTQVFAGLLLAADRYAGDLIARIALVYAHDLSRYFQMQTPEYKNTPQGNWRAG